MILQCHSNCNLCRQQAVRIHFLKLSHVVACQVFMNEQQAGEWGPSVGGSETVAQLIHQGAQDPSSSRLRLMSDVFDYSAMLF